MGIVYILTNQSMPGYVKIGRSRDKKTLQNRILEFNSKTAVPLPFEFYYGVEVPDFVKIEAYAHKSHNDKRIRGSEFFEVDPDQAKATLKISGGEEVMLETDNKALNLEDQRALAEAKEKIKNRPYFLVLGIQKGETLTFLKDETITCEVADQEKTLVEFEDSAKISLSGSARAAFEKIGNPITTVQGAAHWCYNGKKLTELYVEVLKGGE